MHVKTESVVPFDEGAASWEMVRVKEGVEVSWRLSGRNKGWGGRTDADIGLMFVQPREGWVCNVDGTGRGRGRGREAVRGSDS